TARATSGRRGGPSSTRKASGGNDGCPTGRHGVLQRAVCGGQRGHVLHPVGRQAPPGLDHRTGRQFRLRGAPPLRERLAGPQRATKRKGKEVPRSLPLSTYSALGGLPQGPGRTAESSAEPETWGK